MDPTVGLLAGIIITMMGFWVKTQVERFTKTEDRQINQGGNFAAMSQKIETLWEERDEHKSLRDIVNRLDSTVNRAVQDIEKFSRAMEEFTSRANGSHAEPDVAKLLAGLVRMART